MAWTPFSGRRSKGSDARWRKWAGDSGGEENSKLQVESLRWVATRVNVLYILDAGVMLFILKSPSWEAFISPHHFLYPKKLFVVQLVPAWGISWRFPWPNPESHVAFVECGALYGEDGRSRYFWLEMVVL